MGRLLNFDVSPSELLTGRASTFGSIPVSLVQLPSSNLARVVTGIILQTTLTSADMVSATYWDGYSVQAPFYVFIGVAALSNLRDATQIGNFNVQEYYTPVRVPANTDLFGYWLGVNTASANKCQATFLLDNYVPGGYR